MPPLICTLVADGSSDRALLPIIDFLIASHYSGVYQPSQQASGLPSPSKGLSVRINAALRDFPCSLLVVHRDAERRPVAEREDEVRQALSQIDSVPHHVCVVPVRMTEAWLLLDEDAIRCASGNPNGRGAIAMPPANRIEQLPDPKELLQSLLEEASNKPRRQSINFNQARQRVSEVMQHEKLRQLSSFQHFESAMAAFLESI